MGYYRKNGLNIKFEITNDDSIGWNQIKSKSQNNIKLAIGDPFSMISDNNQVGKIIGQIIHRPILYGVSNKPIPFIRDFKDFNGKTIAIYSKPSTTYYLLTRLLSEYKAENVKIVEYKPSDLMTIIKDPKMDIIFVNEPRATYLEKFEFRRIFILSNEIDEFMMSSIFASDETLKNHGVVVNRFLTIIDKVLTEMNTDFNKSIELASKEFDNYDKIEIYKALANLYSDNAFPTNSKITLRCWENYVKYRFPKSEIGIDSDFNNNIWDRLIEEK